MSFNAKNFTPEVIVSKKTSEALAEIMTDDPNQGQEFLARLNKTKEVAQEMLDKITSDNTYCSNAKVDISKYGKDDKDKIYAQISFSGKVNPKDKDSLSHTLSLSVKEDGSISYVKAQMYDPANRKFSDVKFNDMANSLKVIKDKLADFGYIKAYKASEKTPFEKTVSAFKSAVYEYNESHDNKLTMGHGVYDEDKNPVLDESGKRVWNDVTHREYEGKDYMSIDIVERNSSSNEMFKFNININGDITSANYVNFDNKEENTFTYDLNRWKETDSFISDIIKSALEKFDYKIPPKPEKSDIKEVNEELELELPFQ